MPSAIDKHTVVASESIRNAIKQMDVNDAHFLVVITPDKKVVGVFTSGDFRRAVLTGLDINEEVSKIVKKDFLSLNKGYFKKEVYRLFEDRMVNDLPVLHNGKLVEIVHRKDFFTEDEAGNGKNNVMNLPVVIMAGGKGERLDPFTRILPKPLIPLGNVPVIKVIMDEFGQFGMNDFFISLNDKGRMVKAYFHEHEFLCRITYIDEGKPLGTAGALRYLRSKISGPFFVSNCDIIVRSNYESIYKFHKKGSYDITIVGSMQQYTIPYGVCDINNGGMLKGIREKPEYNFLVNTGLYLLETSILQYIPENKHFDMTDLIRKVCGSGLKVGVFPVSEKSWIDVGQWKEYANTLKELNL